MSWREQLRPGSFRGAPFLIESHGYKGGRRIALHQYPDRDTPWAEDLGRQARRYSLELFVLGPDYMVARDALREALEQAGAGTLVHPYLGMRSVVVDGEFSLDETTREGGMARFRVPFAEAGEKLEPKAATDTASALGGSAAATQAVLADSFASAFSVAALPQWVSDAAVADQLSLVDQLRSLATQITTVPSQLLDWLNQAATLSGGLAQLILSPAGLANEIVSLMAGIQHIATQPIAAVNVYGNLLDWVPDSAPTPGYTPAREQVQANRSALQQLVQGAAVSAGASAVAATPAQSGATVQGFDSRDKSLGVRNQLTTAISDQQLSADAASYAALADLRVSLVRDMAQRAALLPRLVSFTPAAALPSVVIAWRLYADPERAGEIVQRNALAYPGFAPGGEALEVLDA